MTTVSSYQSPAPQTPAQPQPTPYVPPQQYHAQAAYTAAPSQGYGGPTASQAYGRPTTQQPQPQAYPTNSGSAAPDRRAPEAYVLSDTANESIPKDIRDLFPQDDQGRVLFFTRPPIDTRHVVSGRKAADKAQPLVHTEQYLSAKEAREKALAERKRALEEINGHAASINGNKRMKFGHFSGERDVDGRIRVNDVANVELEGKAREKRLKQLQEVRQLQIRAVKMLQRGMRKATVDEYRLKYGDRALEYLGEDQARAKVKLEDEQQRRMLMEDSGQQEDVATDTRKMLNQKFWTGRLSNGSGRFEDDFDNRLPR